MENKKIIGILAIAFIVVLALSLVSAFGKGFMSGKTTDNEEKGQLRKAIESGDYETWAKLKREQITKEKFEEIRKRYLEREEFRKKIQEAKESGNYESLKELKNRFQYNRKNMNSTTQCSFHH